MKLTRILSVFLLLGLAAGCQDLTVANLTDPDRRAALSDAVAVQNLIASSWTSVWSLGQDQGGSVQRILGYADEGTANHRQLIDYASEPRGQYPNSQVGSARFLVEAPWYEAYAGAANAMDGLAAMLDNDLQMPTDASASSSQAARDRAEAFAWLNHGILYGYLAMIFDQATTTDHTTDFEDESQLAYRPYPEVRDFAIASLQKAISTANTGEPFEVPGSWMGGVPFTFTNADLVRLANSYIARIMVYSARTPAERAAVDWPAVLQHVEAGIQEDYIVPMTRGGLNSVYFQYLQQILAQRYAADLRLLGPADTSGAYAAWVAADIQAREPFDVVTSDLRIHGTGDPRSPGAYFRWTDEAIGVGGSEQNLVSNYKWHRYAEGTFPWEESPNPVMTVAEMDLIMAEALLRTGDAAGAATLINQTRVANGQLEPVTSAGVPGDLSSCVPRTMDGTACGSLMDALHYEYLIEGVGLDTWFTWFTRRGFGTLQIGTFEQLPVPARELQLLGLDIYSFGGGGEFSADSNEGVQ